MEQHEQEIGAEWGPTPTPGDHHMPLGERIKALRSEAGLSQAELAELPNHDQQALLDHLDALLTRTRLRTITSGNG